MLRRQAEQDVDVGQAEVGVQQQDAPAQFGQRQPRQCEIATDRIDRRQHRQAVGHPMLPRLADREAQFARADDGGDEGAAAFGAHRFDRANVCALVEAKGHNPRRIRRGGGDQAVAMRAVIRDDRHAARLQPLENLTLGIGDGGFVAEEFGMRRGDGGDDRDMRAHQSGQMRQFARVVHAHFEHAEARFGGHPRQAERYAGMVVIAFDRTVRPRPRAAFERGVERFLGAGLADRPGNTDDLCRRPRAGGAGKVLQRGHRVGHENMRVRARLRHQRPRRAARKRLVEEAMAIGRSAGHRDEQVAGADFARIKGHAGGGEVA
ncbi:hypothetical protein D9M73_130090 [compost metagenome]